MADEGERSVQETTKTGDGHDVVFIKRGGRIAFYRPFRWYLDFHQVSGAPGVEPTEDHVKGFVDSQMRDRGK
jgi:hypothetical protein